MANAIAPCLREAAGGRRTPWILDGVRAYQTGWLILALGLSASMVGCGGSTMPLDAGLGTDDAGLSDAGISDAGLSDASPGEDAACFGADTGSADFACYVYYGIPCSCRHGSRFGICTCVNLASVYFDGCPCCPTPAQAVSLCSDQ
jgi:hypothetical protein